MKWVIFCDHSHSLAVVRLLQDFNCRQIAIKAASAPNYALKSEKRMPTTRQKVNNCIEGTEVSQLKR